MSAMKIAKQYNVIEIEQLRRAGKMKWGNALVLGCSLSDQSFPLPCCDHYGWSGGCSMCFPSSYVIWLPDGFSQWKTLVGN